MAVGTILKFVAKKGFGLLKGTFKAAAKSGKALGSAAKGSKLAAVAAVAASLLPKWERIYLANVVLMVSGRAGNLGMR